jgi:hypothetical protein
VGLQKHIHHRPPIGRHRPLPWRPSLKARRGRRKQRRLPHGFRQKARPKPSPAPVHE